MSQLLRQRQDHPPTHLRRRRVWVRAVLYCAIKTNGSRFRGQTDAVEEFLGLRYAYPAPESSVGVGHFDTLQGGLMLSGISGIDRGVSEVAQEEVETEDEEEVVTPAEAADLALPMRQDKRKEKTADAPAVIAEEPIED